ncbi:MAG: GNAT family N-acetyltransferase [Armatimonadetes bacterium]|nr:GNAT family N-acetyltransferase [Armatimonadota bacterium]
MPGQDSLSAIINTKTVTPQHALRAVRSGDRVYIGSNCGQPETLCRALVGRRNELSGVELVHLIVFGEAPYLAQGLQESFRHAAFFVGPNSREAVQAGLADYIPVFLSDLPRLFNSGQMRLDVALIAVSPPDEHGFCSMGVSVDIGMAACKNARTIIAEVNPNMPRTLGDSFLHVSDIDFLVPVDAPIIEHLSRDVDENSEAIAQQIATLIPDGSTMQTGIGRIPSAVLDALSDHNDIGIHTEMFSDSLIHAIRRGNVTCRKKSLHLNKVLASFCIGTRVTYDSINNNPFFYFAPTEYVNDPWVIGQNDRMVSINGALQVDLTGQVVSDSLGPRPYSGIGGQVDFIRGAARSKGGKPVIALSSTAQGGNISRIVGKLNDGAGVVTSRGDVHYVVTEHGIAYLHGKSIRERALSLIRIADPKFRESLLEEAKQLGYIAKDHPPVSDLPMEIAPRWIETRSGQEILIRPIRPTDDQLLRKHFYSLSPEAVRRRFNRMVKSLDNRTIAHLVNVDFHRHVGLVATQKHEEAEFLIATGRYFLDEGSNLAEVAFAVLDEWQGQGIATKLLSELIAIAKRAKIRGLVGYISPDNLSMVHVMQKTGFPTEERLEDGMRCVTVWLEDPKDDSGATDGTPLPDRSSP